MFKCAVKEGAPKCEPCRHKRHRCIFGDIAYETVATRSRRKNDEARKAGLVYQAASKAASGSQSPPKAAQKAARTKVASNKDLGAAPQRQSSRLKSVKSKPMVDPESESEGESGNRSEESDEVVDLTRATSHRKWSCFCALSFSNEVSISLASEEPEKPRTFPHIPEDVLRSIPQSQRRPAVLAMRASRPGPPPRPDTKKKRKIEEVEPESDSGDKEERLRPLRRRLRLLQDEKAVIEGMISAVERQIRTISKEK